MDELALLQLAEACKDIEDHTWQYWDSYVGIHSTMSLMKQWNGFINFSHSAD